VFASSFAEIDPRHLTIDMGLVSRAGPYSNVFGKMDRRRAGIRPKKE
jgi:hypothetical protein